MLYILTSISTVLTPSLVVLGAETDVVSVVNSSISNNIRLKEPLFIFLDYTKLRRN